MIEEFLRILYCCHQYTLAWVQTHSELAKGLDILAAMLDLDGVHMNEKFTFNIEESSGVQIKTEIGCGEESTSLNNTSEVKSNQVDKNWEVERDALNTSDQDGTAQHNQMIPLKNDAPIHEVLKNLKYLKPVALKTSVDGDQDPLSESSVDVTEPPLQLDPNNVPCPVSLHNCPDCPKTFATRRHLVIHFRNVHKKKASKISAKTKTWSKVRGSKELQQAIKAVKEGGMSCSSAARMFSISNSTLQTYVNGTYNHPNELPFKCSVCEKGFSVAYYLKLHKSMHSNEVPFHCKFCDKGFKQKCNMTKHERTCKAAKVFSDSLEQKLDIVK